MNQYSRLMLHMLITLLLMTGAMACGKEYERRHSDDDAIDDVGLADTAVMTDTYVPPPENDIEPNTESDVEDSADTSDVENSEDIAPSEVPIQLEGHQICAASGRASNGAVIAIHCMGAHDASGFQAQNEHVIWQPGVFQVLTQ